MQYEATVPTFEDKIVQRAVAMLLAAIYEHEFHDCSYGFREGRSPHQALNELRAQGLGKNIHWIIDADISGFFDNIDHQYFGQILSGRS